MARSQARTTSPGSAFHSAAPARYVRNWNGWAGPTLLAAHLDGILRVNALFGLRIQVGEPTQNATASTSPVPLFTCLCSPCLQIPSAHAPRSSPDFPRISQHQPARIHLPGAPPTTYLPESNPSTTPNSAVHPSKYPPTPISQAQTQIQIAPKSPFPSSTLPHFGAPLSAIRGPK